ncbi:hypothetical protein HYC85_022356 [Camellia sinensis]|uniref:Exoribonuclease phosphorolytic domain-containing protein n=1 Tax=Camellia sinensis TaxID=4442 RepID=A0A7J7GK74_CAMSI|nr:hypothetical protein HYC85_022356 [Camellia sinensis]
MINFKELSLVSGKATWMAYLVMTYIVWMLMVLFLMLHYLQQLLPSLIIPVVSLNDDGRVVVVSEEDIGKLKNEPVNKGKRKLKLSSIPFSLTCILHKNYILADSTVEEESIMETLVTVVLDSFFQLVSLYKPGGPVLAYTSTIQVCFHLFQSTFWCEIKFSNVMFVETLPDIPIYGCMSQTVSSTISREPYNFRIF